MRLPLPRDDKCYFRKDISEELEQNCINEFSMPPPKWDVFIVEPQILIVKKRQREKKELLSKVKEYPRNLNGAFVFCCPFPEIELPQTCE